MSAEPDETPQPGTPAPLIPRPLLAMAAAALAVPALIPVLVLIEPRLVPFIPAPETTDVTTIVVMAGASLFLLAANLGFLYLMYRWVNKLGARP